MKRIAAVLLLILFSISIAAAARADEAVFSEPAIHIVTGARLNDSEDSLSEQSYTELCVLARPLVVENMCYLKISVQDTLAEFGSFETLDEALQAEIELRGENAVLVYYVLETNEAAAYIGSALPAVSFETEEIQQALCGDQALLLKYRLLNVLEALYKQIPTRRIVESRFTGEEDERLKACLDGVREYFDGLIEVYYVPSAEVTAAECLELAKQSHTLYAENRIYIAYYYETGEGAVYIGSETGITGVDTKAVGAAFKPVEDVADFSGFQSGVDELARELARDDSAAVVIAAVSAAVLIATAAIFIAVRQKRKRASAGEEDSQL
ncbi:MAG: hypothetical protein ACI3VB_09335 [Oscillospiraceae bacterium]